jgi:hypothetical protein
MNCEQMTDTITGMIAGTLSPAQLAEGGRHLAGCQACDDALRGAGALALLKARLKAKDAGEPPPGLFEKILERLEKAPESNRAGRRFWAGTAFGGAIAAAFFAAAFALGWVALPATLSPDPVPDIAEFRVALGERRNLDLAIETDRVLEDARISILLAGSVELDGFGSRRELTWTSDLKAGVNKLSLPVVAIGQGGGQVIVRLSHPHSEQVFVVNLKPMA